MVLVACHACNHRVSEQAVACPSCGHPGAADRRGLVATLGRVAGTYVTANAVSGLVLGSVMFVCTASVLITLILAGR